MALASCRVLLAALVALAPLATAPAAWALTQPNGAVIPSPMGCSGNQPTGLQAALACACTQPGVCNIGAPCAGGASTCDDGKHGTCEATIWHAPNDNSCIPSNHFGVDPAASASTKPETFHPTCALTFTVVTRGTAQFQNVFGWYNATTGSAPAPADLHPMLQCGDAAGHAVVLDLHKEPAWKGGDIGFFLITPEQHGQRGQCAGGNCCPSVARIQGGEGYVYYSQTAFNPDLSGASPFIHLLSLVSSITPHKFYFAWEDTFETVSADFTDIVTSVEGVDCTGGGETCDTGEPGICALGVTQCSQGGAVACQPVQTPKPETCNGLDDDCDGAVDRGATCPSAGDVCENGACVHPCGSSEFPCRSGLTCDDATGHCVDPACVGEACAADQVCRGGTCVKACDGVTCPAGQTCVGDACVDLCAGVPCGAGQVCRQGTCFAGCASCGGIACGAAMTCVETSGQCVDPSCPQGCGAGTTCKAGTCVDACAGVACPHAQQCVAGQCVELGAPGTDAGGLSTPGGGGGVGAGLDGGINGDEPAYPDVTSKAGCACTVHTSALETDAAGALFALVALAVAITRRRRPRAG